MACCGPVVLWSCGPVERRPAGDENKATHVLVLKRQHKLVAERVEGLCSRANGLADAASIAQRAQGYLILNHGKSKV